MTRLATGLSGRPRPIRRRSFNPALWMWLNNQQREDQRYQQDARTADQRFKLIADLVRGNQNSYNQARQANESRYNDILQLYGVTRGDVLGDLENYGQSRLNETNRQFDTTRNNLMADLALRGMSGSTRRIPIESSVAQGRLQAQERIEDDLRERRAALKERFADKAGGVMERRTDAYPDAYGLGNIGSLLGALDTGPAPNYSLPPLPPELFQQFMQPPQEGPLQFGPGNSPFGGGGGGGGGYRSRTSTAPAALPTPSAAESMRERNIAQQRSENDRRARTLQAAYADASHGGYGSEDVRSQLANQLVDMGYAYRGPGFTHFVNREGMAPAVNWGGGTPAQMLPGGQSGGNLDPRIFDLIRENARLQSQQSSGQPTDSPQSARGQAAPQSNQPTMPVPLWGGLVGQVPLPQRDVPVRERTRKWNERLREMRKSKAWGMPGAIWELLQDAKTHAELKRLGLL